MEPMLRILQPSVKPIVAGRASDTKTASWHELPMSQQSRIHAGKTPRRIHFIVEWAEHRSLRQTDIASALEVEKSTVSRWFSGHVPSDKHIYSLAKLFQLDEPSDLFRHPEDDWLARFFRERTESDRERAIQILKAAFPLRAGSKTAS